MVLGGFSCAIKHVEAVKGFAFGVYRLIFATAANSGPGMKKTLGLHWTE